MSGTLRVNVAAGILRDVDDRVLLAERRGDPQWAGLWEFPGGKIDDGESATDALHRELNEELGIDVRRQRRFMKLEHRYADRCVSIEFYVVDAWSGRPHGREGQTLRWLAIDRLDEALLLPADAPVVEALKELRSRRGIS